VDYFQTLPDGDLAQQDQFADGPYRIGRDGERLATFLTDAHDPGCGQLRGVGARGYHPHPGRIDDFRARFVLASADAAPQAVVEEQRIDPDPLRDDFGEDVQIAGDR
jgi:hypothetical protein